MKIISGNCGVSSLHCITKNGFRNSYDQKMSDMLGYKPTIWEYRDVHRHNKDQLMTQQNEMKLKWSNQDLDTKHRHNNRRVTLISVSNIMFSKWNLIVWPLSNVFYIYTDILWKLCTPISMIREGTNVHWALPPDSSTPPPRPLWIPPPFKNRCHYSVNAYLELVLSTAKKKLNRPHS